MKNLYFFLIACLISIQSFSQKLDENQKDEFTGNLIKRTSWETLQSDTKFTSYFRISRINETYYFDLKLMLGNLNYFAIGKDQEIMFKFDNDSVLILKSLTHEISSIGAGAKGLVGSGGQGVKISYLLSLSDIDKLRNNKAIKWRIYTTDGYLESEKIADKYSLIPKALKLVCD